MRNGLGLSRENREFCMDVMMLQGMSTFDATTLEPCNRIPESSVDYRARVYDATINRFVQPDSIVPNIGNSQDILYQ